MNFKSSRVSKTTTTTKTQQQQPAARAQRVRVVAPAPPPPPPPPKDVVPDDFAPVVRIFLVRHGETEQNRLGIVQGTMDTVLNEEGIKQAELVAEELKEIPFSCVLSSDLKRCLKVCPHLHF